MILGKFIHHLRFWYLRYAAAPMGIFNAFRMI